MINISSSSDIIIKALEELEKVPHMGALDVKYYKILTEKFLDLVCTKEFLELSSGAVTRLLGNDFLGIDSESDVLRAAFRWIHADKDARIKFSNDILNCVKLVYIDAPDIFACLEGKEYISFSSYCNHHFHQALWYQTCKNHNQLDKVFFEIPKPRKSTHAEMSKSCLVCMKKSGLSNVNTATNLSYKFQNQKWTKMPNMLKERSDHQLVAFQKKLFAIGGCNKQTMQIESVENYDPRTNEWSESEPIPEATMSLASCVQGNYIWISGGIIKSSKEDKAKMTKNVEIYDQVHKKWFHRPQLLIARSYHSMISSGKHLYIIGGAALSDKKIISLNSVEYFNEGSRTWESIASFKIPRLRFGSVYIDKKILIMGGYNSQNNVELDSCECLDIDNEKWGSRIENMPDPIIGNICSIKSLTDSNLCYKDWYNLFQKFKNTQSILLSEDDIDINKAIQIATAVEKAIRNTKLIQNDETKIDHLEEEHNDNINKIKKVNNDNDKQTKSYNTNDNDKQLKSYNKYNASYKKPNPCHSCGGMPLVINATKLGTLLESVEKK
ncbi:kelch-like protein 31 [Gordionus sp. m RMFG-2023]|uniref:kelch-like protein 31 n=1 Tax=Gordionus sp. m RMFG-2023 TaxID=3053472 RepID=UPI0031FD5518